MTKTYKVLGPHFVAGFCWEEELKEYDAGSYEEMVDSFHECVVSFAEEQPWLEAEQLSEYHIRFEDGAEFKLVEN